MQSVHSAHRAVLHQVGGKPLPLGYGDFAAETAALEQGAGVVDLEACGVIGVRGPDAVLFLNGVVTNNVKALAIGRPQGNLLCGTKGKILHVVTVLRVKDEDYLVITEPGELDAVATHLDNYHIREDLQMGVAGLTRLDVIGPMAEATLSRAGLDPERLVAPYDGGVVVTAPLPLGATPRRLVLVPAPRAPALAEALLGAGARLAGYDSFDEVRIWARVPRFGVDFGPDFLPAEAAIYTHVAFDKGCYVGQEVHARQHYRGHANRKLVAVDIQEPAAATLNPGADLFLGAEAVGRLTSLSRTIRRNEGGDPVRRGIALVRFAVASEWPSLASTAGGSATISLTPLATDLGAIAATKSHPR